MCKNSLTHNDVESGDADETEGEVVGENSDEGELNGCGIQGGIMCMVDAEM